MRRLLVIISLSLGLTACATTPAPPLFQGSSGWKTLPNTTKLIATKVASREMIAEREIEFIRTGTLKTDVKNMLGVVKMKAGSPVYAASYGGQPQTFSSLAWCAPSVGGKDVGSFLTGENDVECLMYNSLTGRAVRTDGNSTSRFFARSMTPTSTSIAIPEIEEGPVDFGRRLTLRLSASSLTGKTLDAIEMFHDGEDQTILRQRRLTFDENETVAWAVWGGELRLTRTGAEDNPMLNIVQVRPFTNGSLTKLQMQQLLQSLQSQKPNTVASGNASN